MIISRFGSTWAAAYVFGQLKGADTYRAPRTTVLGQVGGMSGAYDFNGTAANPIAAKMVTKKFMLVVPIFWCTGIGRLEIESTYPNSFNNLKRAGGDPFSEAEIEVGDHVRFTEDSVVYDAIVTSIDGASLFVADPDALPETITYPGATFEVGKATSPYANVERELEKMKLAVVYPGESKLWGLLRDTTHLWAWAKFEDGSWAEDYTTKLALPVELIFSLREGIWYGETEQVVTRTAHGTFTVTNNGQLPALVRFELLNVLVGGNPTITQVKLTNTTNGYEWTYDGDVVPNNLLRVFADSYRCTNGDSSTPDVGDFDGLTIGTHVAWMQLEPGDNSLTVALTPNTGNYTYTVKWYDTYIL